MIKIQYVNFKALKTLAERNIYDLTIDDYDYNEISDNTKEEMLDALEELINFLDNNKAFIDKLVKVYDDLDNACLLY